jgi:hypothetical protein
MAMSGSAEAAAIASQTARAPCPARAGPFLGLGPLPCPNTRGRRSRLVNRVVRSTGVPIAGAVEPKDQIAFPMPGNGAVVNLSSPSADHGLGSHELFTPTTGAGRTRSDHPVRRHARQQNLTAAGFHCGGSGSWAAGFPSPCRSRCGPDSPYLQHRSGPE